MNWFRRSIALASLGGLGLLQSASAQDNGWRVSNTGVAAPVAPGEPRRINLGKPSPLPAGALPIANSLGVRDDAVKPASYSGLPRPTVVRAMREFEEGEPGNLFLPKELLPPAMLPTLPPAGSFPPVKAPTPREPRLTPKIIDVDNTSKVLPIQSQEKLPTLPRRVVERPIASSEPVLIIEDGASLNGSEIFEVTAPPTNRFYVTAEWLHWATNGFRVPQLAFTSTSLAFDPRGNPVLGPRSVLFGEGTVLSRMGPGARFTVGFQPNPCTCCWWEASAFFLARQTESASFSSDRFPIIARPYFEINNNQPFQEFTAAPGLLSGRLDINLSTALWGAELNKRCLWYESDTWRISSLVGFRYLDLRDTVRITEDSTALVNIPGVADRGDRQLLLDRFDTRNQFFGGQLGMNAEWRSGRWSVDARLRIALGATHQAVDVEGFQRLLRANGTTQNFVGGLYALSSNIGKQAQTRLSFVPEVGLKVGYDLSENVRIFVGYDFLLWNNVIRAGDQIDQSLDTNLIPRQGQVQPTAAEVRPRVPFQRSNFWAQGVNAGLEFRY